MGIKMEKNSYKLKGINNLDRFLDIFIMNVRYRATTKELVDQFVIGVEGVDNLGKSVDDVKVSFWVQFNNAKKSWGLPQKISDGRALVNNIVKMSDSGHDMNNSDLKAELIRYIMDSVQNKSSRTEMDADSFSMTL